MTPPLLQWQRERFPFRNGIFFAVFYATALLVGRAAAGVAPALGWRDLPGLAAITAFFLMLRVFDEHKDFAADAVAHPHRALQRGLVTLPQLAAIGGAALALQLGVSLWADRGVGPVTGWWAAAAGWSMLMAREFFAPRWLRARPMLYAFSHLMVMPLVAVWVATMGAPGAAGAPVVWTLAVLAFLAALSFEVARKIRAPEDEHPMAESYTQALGIPTAAALLFGALASAGAVAILLAWLATGRVRTGLAVPLAASVAFAALALTRFRRRPTRAAARFSEATVGIATLGTHLVVIIAILGARVAR